MKRFLLLLLFITSLSATELEHFRWANSETYLQFLERNQLPLRELYYNLDKDDQVLAEEMRAGVNCQVLRDKEKKIIQALLPLNDELQIHIYKTEKNYAFEVIPIISETRTEAFTIQITHSPYQDILKETGSVRLAGSFVAAFKNSLNFKNDIQKGDTLVMIYDQKYRLGETFSMPILKAAMIQMGKKTHYIYLNDDDRYYDINGHEVEGFLLAKPVTHSRISSTFTKRRFHPILKKWKAHLGVDYAAPPGTPIMAAGSGRVAYVGKMGAYGNLIKITHDDGYETRYAHMKSFRKGVQRGKTVKKGQVIGYVGTTGRSTGPHLHFELRKHGQAMNPLRVVQVATKKLKGKEYNAFVKVKENYDQSIALHLENKTRHTKVMAKTKVCYFHYKPQNSERIDG
ncbi:MAG: peptidoglycan DD-metalloendopeptidase family protein [Sulfurimonadaceae bacterium]|jgi:murein DD-endopeptidase MepM/ murein hydrolase activator NlpD|nr:peptidoglycan DD-metalloendopeptidase family protein [Sulfurimonadaceae bacterium]